MKILAVIPARGGSKGIPKKNVRLMNGKPLIWYSINNALSSKYITDVVVSTDDDEIAYVANVCGASIIKRPKELANDVATLDPVVYQAIEEMEKKIKCKYDIVVTLQATSPLLTVQTLDKALEDFIASNDDTYISVINSPHLSWRKDEKDNIVPAYKERLNRQQLPANYLETGAFFFSKRNIITENSRVGRKVSVYEIPENESIDIDNVNDWIVCENQLRRKKIVLRCDGNKDIGMGHIYHCINLAYNLTNHDTIIVTNRNSKEGLEKIKESNLKHIEINNDAEFFDYLEKNNIDIVVNDCLDTSEEYVKRLKTLVKKVVVIEDMGAGNKYADVVINALYDNCNIPYAYTGYKYISLRPEFLITKVKPFNIKVKNVVVLFGGTDPSNLAEKIHTLVKKDKYSKINFKFICGIGSSFNIKNEYKNIEILKNVSNISEYMSNADIAFTSQGRTVYELANFGIPSIVMAQNQREQLHSFAYMNNGFVNLGLGKDVNIETIENTFDWLISTPYVREEMRNLMLKNDLKHGIENEISVILEERKVV